MTKKCCANCIYFHLVHEYNDKDGKLNWFDSLPNVKDENGNDISANAYRCTRFSYFGDRISYFDINTEDACDEFEELIFS